MNAALLLAAGNSSRLGTPKQLIDWNGRTLIDWTIEQLAGTDIDQIHVILGAFADRIWDRSRWLQQHSIVRTSKTARPSSDEIELSISINTEWETGQGSSLKQGIYTLISQLKPPESSRLLVTVCDQPLLLSVDYQRLMEAVSEPITVAAAAYRSGGGVPACFSATVLPSLLLDIDNGGAKNWIRTQVPDTIQQVDLSSSLTDIDTEADYRRLLQDFSTSRQTERMRARNVTRAK